jgi:hypothetical protein
MKPIKQPQADDAVRAGKRARDGEVVVIKPRERDNGKAWDAALEQARVDLDALRGESAAVSTDPLFTKTGADLLAASYPAPPYLVRNLLVDHGVQAISAEAKGTKTWITMEIALALASATPVFGRFPTCRGPSHVVLFQAEDSERASRAKIRSIGASRGMSADEMRAVAGRLHFHNLGRIDVLNRDHAARVVASVRALPEKPCLLIVDPLVKVHRVDENKSQEMELVTNALADIGRVLGLAVGFSHHNGKANENTGKRRGGQRMRGSSSLHGAVDGGLYLDAPTGDLSTTWIVKANSEIKGARSAGPFTLTLRVLEDDEHGEARRISWDVDGEGSDPLELAARRVADVVALLDRAPGPLSVRAIERALRLRHGEATDPLRDLEGEGRARRTREGWLLVPVPIGPGDGGSSGPAVPALRSPLKRGDGDRSEQPVRSRSLGTDGDGGREVNGGYFGDVADGGMEGE